MPTVAAFSLLLFLASLVLLGLAWHLNRRANRICRDASDLISKCRQEHPLLQVAIDRREVQEPVAVERRLAS